MRAIVFAAALAATGCGTVLDPAFYEARTGPHWTFCDDNCPTHRRDSEKTIDAIFDYRSHNCACWYSRDTDAGKQYRFEMFPAGKAKRTPILWVCR